VVSAAFHETGHAAATRYGGARPGAMGVGLYLVWPAFYTDLTDAYRLGRAGRLRADLGGVYFNTIFMLVTAGAYFVTGHEALLLLIPLQHLEIVHQLLPFLRLDGYYIVSDLTGVPDMLSRIKPTLKSLVPGLAPDPRAQQLKPWARGVVTIYLVLLVPVMLALFALMAFAAPRVFATAWDALGVNWEHLRAMVDRREAAASLVSVIQLVLLCISPIGLALALTSAVRRITGAIWGWTEPRPRTRAVMVAVTSATATAVFVNWWLNGTYEPVARGERGTISARVFDVRKVIERESGEPRKPRHQSVPERRRPRSVDPAAPPAPETPRAPSTTSTGSESRTTRTTPSTPNRTTTGSRSSTVPDWTTEMDTTNGDVTTEPLDTTPVPTTPDTGTTTDTKPTP
jgi:putative peptide zinc metalloprotease protein